MRGNQVILDILNNSRVAQERNGGFCWLQSLNRGNAKVKFVSIIRNQIHKYINKHF